MNDRRQFLSLGLAGLAGIAMPAQTMQTGFGIRTIAQWDLPSVSLNGWQATLRGWTFPSGLESPKHNHPGFVLGYVLEGQSRIRIKGQPEKLLSAGETFYERPRSIHLSSGSASSTKSLTLFAALLAMFAVTMTIAHGIKVPLGYGVFTALGGALLLATAADIRFSEEREPKMSSYPPMTLVAEESAVNCRG